MSAKTRAVYYTRVSTGEQAEHGTSLAGQKKRCLAYIKENKLELVEGYTDEGVSGASEELHRPAFMAMMNACRAGGVDVVVVADMDRFSRDLRNQLNARHDLEQAGAELHPLSGTMSEFEKDIRGTFAAEERRKIRERTMRGLIDVAKQGFWAGGPAPYGFRLDKNADGSGHTRLALDDRESEMLRLAVSEILGGRSTWKTAELLNELGFRPRRAAEWSYHLLRRVLVDAQLSGRWSYGRPYGWGRSRSEGEFTVDIPKIVTPEEHAALREILMGNATTRSERIGFFLVSRGVLVSPCGRNFRGRARKDRGTYRYVCPNTEWNTSGTRCDCKTVPGDWIDGLVWSEVKRLLSDPDHLLSLADAYLDQRIDQAGAVPDDLTAINRKIAELEHARTTTATDYLKAGVAPDLLQVAVAEIDRELTAWRRRAERARAFTEETTAAKGRLSQLQEMAQRASKRLDSLSPEEQRVVIEALELKVQVLGWEPCETCGGSGKVKGGKGGAPCPSCRMVKAVPRLRIEGIWSSALDDERGALSQPGADAPHTGTLVRFDDAAWSGMVGATRPA